MAYTRKFKKGDVIKSRIDDEIDQVTRIVLDKKKSSHTYGQVVYILSQQDDLWPCEYIDNTYEKIEPKSKSKQPTKAKTARGRKSRKNKRKKTFNKSYKR